MPADRVHTTDRPARPAVPPPPGFESLDRTHRQMQDMLARFAALLDHVEDKGTDEAARRTAAEISAFFDGPARQHHAEEERRVFPALLDCKDPELVHHVKRLQQDHGWLEEDWRELAPQVQAIAQGYNWYNLTMLRHALPVFTALHAEHIVLEEDVVYPAASQLQQALGQKPAARSLDAEDQGD